MTRRATCCCGACSIAVEGEPVVNGVCHCDNCRRRTGSAFGWSAYFPDDRIVAIEGDLAVYVLDAADPNRQRRSFCPACGTTLFWRASYFPGHAGIAGGCFVEGQLDEPGLTATDDKRLHWLTLPDNWARIV